MKRIAALLFMAWLSCQPAQAFEPFTISDIRIDGLQRISAGTVFTYLPVENGDRIDKIRGQEAMRALFRTGFFSDVRLERQGDILVVAVTERPAISKITLVGNKDIKTEDLTKGLAEIGLAEGEVFDRLQLDRVTQELNRQYNNRGKYNVSIRPQVSQLDRNRVEIVINIAEGRPAKIRHVNIVGNTVFSDDELMDEFESSETNWLSWYRSDDQYSREKLSGDLEKLRSYYLDRGYVDFNVESTQVTISPDRREIFITINVREGEVYDISESRVTGELILDPDFMNGLIQIRAGDTFSRRRLEQTTELMEAVLGNSGYAFATVTPIPDVNRDNRTVAVTFFVEPGKRVYVRRLSFVGNARTEDEVLRREFRQLEGAWLSQAALDRSKIRLQRLQYFSSVEIETPPVPGTDDQVDVVVTVEERASGTFTFALGFSELQGVITTVEVSQTNFLGTGNQVSLGVSNNRLFRRFDFNYLNPYWTDDGVSRGFNVFYRELDQRSQNIASYTSDTLGLIMSFGVPLTETTGLQMRLGYDRNDIQGFPDFTPQPILDYLALTGNTFETFRGDVFWSRDSRNRLFNASSGSLTRLGAEIALPGSTVHYYKVFAQGQRYWPIGDYSIMTNLEVGYGDGYNSNDQLPFFENFYAGGVRSVRGYEERSLGPTGDVFDARSPLGGALQFVTNLEFAIPVPFVEDEEVFRLAAFYDAGNVFASPSDFETRDLRMSVGLSMSWRAPVGPIIINLAYPFNNRPGDFVERIQFAFGSTF